MFYDNICCFTTKYDVSKVVEYLKVSINVSTSVQCIRDLLIMRYINLHITSLLTYFCVKFISHLIKQYILLTCCQELLSYTLTHL